jgi:hypothetical protein
MGHATMRATLIYQHATRERDHKIANGLSETIKAARRPVVEGGTVRPVGHANRHERRPPQIATISR